MSGDGDGTADRQQPAGGLSEKPLPRLAAGYTLKITFHRARNLMMADVNSQSSDPYLLAQLQTAVPSRHREDPPLQLRTPTKQRTVDPDWECVWTVGNVPASGFQMKVRIYDEDPGDHDDRLGNAHVNVERIDDRWPGIRDQPFPLKMRVASKRALLIKAAVVVATAGAKRIAGALHVSVELLGRTADSTGGRVYTVGPNWWTCHSSPLLGRFTGSKGAGAGAGAHHDRPGQTAERYNFQANQLQLRGPVPSEMYHRYVEFRPFIKAMFTDKGVRGFILNKALHHQHNAIYKYDRSTVYGCFDEPGPDMTAKFLALAHHDSGGRIFTYIITLDGLFRFTETGKEFGIDFLSKHTMHSDVNIYIAFSGEFFIRRRNSLPAGSSQMPADAGQELKSPSAKKSEHSEPLDIDNYELYIDNDSGTYRPAAKLLPTFKEFLERNFPGLAINTLDCQGDADKMKKMKEEQREKKAESKRMVFHQGSISGSISSSDEEALEHLEAGHEQNERGALHQVKKVIVGKGKTAVGQAKDFKPGRKEGKKNNPVSPLDIDADAKE